MNNLQIAAAIETLRAAGFVMSPPPAQRLQLLSVAEFASIVGWKDQRAARRAIEDHFPRSIMLPGGDLRVYLADVEEFLASRERIKVAA